MQIIKNHKKYNAHRYSTPWVAKVNPENAKIDFGVKIGGYTGTKSEEYSLYVENPIENAVYAYGQKDYNMLEFSPQFPLLMKACSLSSYLNKAVSRDIWTWETALYNIHQTDSKFIFQILDYYIFFLPVYSVTVSFKTLTRFNCSGLKQWSEFLL